MILLLDEVRHRENMTAEEVKAAFLSSVARMAPRLPFSYFSPQVMAAQLLERLRGVPFNGAKYIAEHYLEDAVLVNDVRCAYCYTGMFEGVRVSVMAVGMGGPSMLIYARSSAGIMAVRSWCGQVPPAATGTI